LALDIRRDDDDDDNDGNGHDGKGIYPNPWDMAFGRALGRLLQAILSQK
jgi:hypothetical protein